MTTLTLYHTYRFQRDPAMDEVVELMNATDYTQKEIHARCNVSVGTLGRWKSKKTRRPQHATLVAAARAVGWDFKLIKSDQDFVPTGTLGRSKVKAANGKRPRRKVKK